MEEAMRVAGLALSVIGAPEPAAATSFPCHPEDAPMVFDTIPIRYLTARFLLVNEVRD
jgi:hypothetical protein